MDAVRGADLIQRHKAGLGLTVTVERTEKINIHLLIPCQNNPTS